MTATIETLSIEQMRFIDAKIADLYVTKNRYIASKENLRRNPPVSWKIDEWNERMDNVNRAMAEIDEQIDEINEQYTGWNRFFYVKHLHSSANCSSFRWNTRIMFVPEISGLTEDEAVAEYGSTLCTKCFESAPVD